MTRTTSSRVKELFLEAREQDPARQHGFVEAACGGDETLARRVLALLRADTSLGEGLLAPAPTVNDAPEEIDRYELLEVIGEGGFGTVYRARRRTGVSGEVAVKVLRAETESARTLARFRAEQRSLEAMEHPGIARVLDAGSTQAGRPFIAMELVRGEPITNFSDHERLTILERAALLADVCRAVQHAHSKGVIHRDLKPSNILAWRADGRCWAKVIDFGIAKALTSDGDGVRTSAQELIGTPAYMSPEQGRGRGGDVDTRSDVYALGAVLYELLCSHPVIEQESVARLSPGELERLVCDVVPPLPSARTLTPETAAARATDPQRLARRLRGEIDWVVMRALEKDRARRYPTAQALADDLDRLIRGEAVEAAPPSRVYRLSRLIRREKGLFAGLAITMTVVIAAGIVATALTLRAQQAEASSEQARRVADAVNNFLRKDLLAAAAPDGGVRLPDEDVRMREVLDEASRRIEVASRPGGNLEHEPLVQAGVLQTLAETYLARGEFARGVDHAKRAVTLYTAALGEDADETLRAAHVYARGLRGMCKFEEAYALFSSIRERAVRKHGDRDPLTLDAETGMAAVASWGLYDFEQAESLLRRVHAVRSETLGPEHPDTLSAAFGLVRTLHFADRHAECLTLASQLWEQRRGLFGDHDPEVLHTRWFVARSLSRLTPPRYDESEAIHLEVYNARKSVLPANHPGIAVSECDLAEIYLATDRPLLAVPLLEATVERQRRSLGPDHLDTLGVESALGEAWSRTGRKAEGLALLHSVAARAKQLPLGGDRIEFSARDRIKRVEAP